VQDPDVLDTWFSSALWPFSTLGWPEKTADLSRFYPTSVLVTGYDILFFWVARMMMFGLYAMDGQPPFQVVALHGMVRDQYGKKMSKSFGNVVDPLDWIDRFGADATRFTLLRGANPGADVAVSEEWAAGSRNFCNKIWNATRFALMNGATVGELPADLTAADRWILSRLQHTIEAADAAFEEFEFAKVSDLLYHFAWDEVCDWYLELAKIQIAEGRMGTRLVLGHVFDALLRLLHPLVPFVTEELWRAVTGGTSVMVAQWPVADPRYRDPEAEAEITALQELVTEVRRFRSDQGLKPGQRVAARLGLSGTALAAQEGAIRSLLRLEEPGDGFSATARFAVTGVSVEIDTAGAIDVVAERKRLEKDLAAARKEAAQASAKLGNEQFMAKAPDDVVAKVRARATQSGEDIARLEAQLAALPAG
ncbi:class I tRNA ligase family protein, partial [Nonomuraea sp. NPDC055795]